MKQVTISTSMDSPSTRASLDSETGAFSWQSGDLISVLATDGNFYDFILESGVGNYEAEFVGSIPENAYITTVATYPRIVSNGSANTVLVGSTLSYNLPATWTYAKDVSNVPMVAAFSENATHMAFKQVGGVMRFPVKNMPTEAKFIITMEDKTITGAFPVDINNLGTSAMTAGSSASELVINYSSEIDGAYAEFNVPVPTGTYNNFTLTIKDANDKVLFTKEYTSDINKVERATLLNMKEITLPERPMTIAEVWPFFVDARVVFSKVEGVTDYAFYVDGSETPVILTAEELNNGMYGGLIGGKFAHNSTHTVAIAKVVNGTPAKDYISETVEFTTGRIMQMTYNTGTKFICAGWDDVAIGIENSTVYNEVTKKWSLVPVNDEVNGRNVRGYRVQLYAEDKTTLLYDEVPFSGQVDYGGAISSSSWIGKIGGQNVLLPTALSFGWLEPGKKYYFRVQTLAEPVTFNSPETGYFKPNGEGVTLSSPRGGCGWSEFVEMTTDAAHVASENEILFEGFDDMMYNSDIMNVASAAIPQVLSDASSEYASRKSAALYKAWVELPFEQRKFSEQGFNTMLGAYYLGLTDDKYTNNSTLRYLNAYAGSLEGWSILSGGSDKRTVNPNFGSVRLGQSGTSAGKIALRTAPIMSDKLSETNPTKCIITVKVSAHATTEQNVNAVLGVYHYRGEETLDNKNTIQFNLDENSAVSSEWTENYTWSDKNNYSHYPTWFEVKTELNLLKGDVIGFEKANPKVDGVSDFYKGCVTIGEITIEVAPDTNDFEDNGVGTEPDDTDYDVYGLGEFPISYWYTVEPSSYIKDGAYDYDLTKARYQEMKEAGINIALYYGHSVDRSIAENKRIHDICAELGLKFIGNSWAADDATRIQQIKETFGNSETYVGELLRDEPGANEYDALATFVDAYNVALPDKEVYINLFPEYANAATQLKTDYENYIDQYLQKVKTKSLSYDYYGLHKSGGIFTDFYSNLDLVRSKTLDNRMPFWVITQAGIAGSARMPTELDQRWSVWANIAGGSKGISYFCYWTPSGGTYDENGFMIDINGNKNPMYTWVQTINKDINTIGKKLLYCHADGLIASTTTYYPLFDNNSVGRTKYGPVQHVSAVSEHVAVGCFRDARRSENGDNYKGYKVLVTPHQPNRTIVTTLTLDSSVTTITVTQNNTSKVVDLNNLSNVKVIDGDKGINLSYADGKLTLNIPAGEALLIEF